MCVVYTKLGIMMIQLAPSKQTPSSRAVKRILYNPAPSVSFSSLPVSLPCRPALSSCLLFIYMCLCVLVGRGLCVWAVCHSHTNQKHIHVACDCKQTLKFTLISHSTQLYFRLCLFSFYRSPLPYFLDILFSHPWFPLYVLLFDSVRFYWTGL